MQQFSGSRLQGVLPGQRPAGRAVLLEKAGLDAELDHGAVHNIVRVAIGS